MSPSYTAETTSLEDGRVEYCQVSVWVCENAMAINLSQRGPPAGNGKLTK